MYTCKQHRNRCEFCITSCLSFVPKSKQMYNKLTNNGRKKLPTKFTASPVNFFFVA